MPICKTFSNQTIYYLVWKIEENEKELRDLVILSENEILEYSKIGNKHKRLQWLAARVVSKIAIENRGGIYYGIRKDNNGKPHLINANECISISHCADYAIVALSSTHKVGVDIQKCVTKLYFTKTKFLSSAELDYRDLSIQKLCIMWSAKESIYKLFPESISSIKTDILIKDFSKKTNGVLQSLCMRREINVYYESYNDYIISYAITLK